MVPFLKQVASHYYKCGDISERCFVFPNRRSMLFFRKYLAEVVASDKDAKPVLLPHCYTINDFFYKVSGATVTDRVRLLLALYDCYKDLNPSAEPLDDFVFWGDVILGDFNDVDKYLADPKQVFTNVKDFKEIQDDYSYLTDSQREAILRFVHHFRTSPGKLTVDLQSETPDVTRRFLQIWNILLPLYLRFNEYLTENSMAYEGQVYRMLAEKSMNCPVADMLKESFQNVSCFVFVGLNALNKCEKTLMGKLKDAHMAEFCWDWVGDFVTDKSNRSSLFMAENVEEFGQDIILEDVAEPKISVVSVSSAIGQTKRLPEILRESDGADFAVVLPEENLLVPLLNTVPTHVKDINVTMGMPMNTSEFYSMMSSISAIQMHTVNRSGRWLFYHKQVWNLFSSVLFRLCLSEKEKQIVDKIKKASRYYIAQEDFKGSDLLEFIFRPIIKDPKVKSSETIELLAEYQQGVIARVASAIVNSGKMSLELEYAKEYFRCINVLREISLDVLPLTYIKLLGQLLASVSVPFSGEPLKGLQIMGPLETRALDFKNVVIMSANEGVFPRKNVSSSFIPYELRRCFDLPTYEFQDAVWAYYFYRLITRAENVWLFTDSRVEGVKGGEESRYIKQLEYHFGLPLKRYVVRFDTIKQEEELIVDKTAEDVEVIRNKCLSATAFKAYLACPVKFYYGIVKGLKEDEEVVENLDHRMFGNVYHEVMRSLYTCDEAMDPAFYFDRKGENIKKLPKVMKHIDVAHINKWIAREDAVKMKVKSLIARELHTNEVNGRDVIQVDVISKYVKRTLLCDLQLMNEKGIESFEVLGLELRKYTDIDGQMITGEIDRLDRLSSGEIRVVDYKTGKILQDDEIISDDNAADIVEAIFNPESEKRPTIALQFYVYDKILRDSKEFADQPILNCIYAPSRLFKEVPQSYPLNEMFYDGMTDKLKLLLDEIYDVSIPFKKTSVLSNCEYCEFRNICGR